ncbi:hypothetical protein Tco_0716401, partial [Tanacetum coccineum]
DQTDGYGLWKVRGISLLPLLVKQ